MNKIKQAVMHSAFLKEPLPGIVTMFSGNYVSIYSRKWLNWISRCYIFVCWIVYLFFIVSFFFYWIKQACVFEGSLLMQKLWRRFLRRHCLDLVRSLENDIFFNRSVLYTSEIVQNVSCMRAQDLSGAKKEILLLLNIWYWNIFLRNQLAWRERSCLVNCKTCIHFESCIKQDPTLQYFTL